MSQHLYTSTWGRVAWFVRRFGAAELFWKPVRVAFAPLILLLLRRGTFVFCGRELDLFHHRYNMTWATERGVEVPVARAYLDEFGGRRVLEVGNVLSHYGPVAHDVLDKFERGPRVINADIVDFAPAAPYDLVLSISTFEHIGFDDEADEPSDKKILRAIGQSRRLLAPGGKLVLTVPIGYNPQLDRLIAANELGSAAEFYLRRTARRRWEECDRATALRCEYSRPFPYANAILVAEFAPSNA